MNSCSDCVHGYYESDTNYFECTDPEYNETWGKDCPHYYSTFDAKMEAKYGKDDRY